MLNLILSGWLQSYNQKNYFARKMPVPLFFVIHCYSLCYVVLKCAFSFLSNEGQKTEAKKVVF